MCGRTKKRRLLFLRAAGLGWACTVGLADLGRRIQIREGWSVRDHAAGSSRQCRDYRTGTGGRPVKDFLDDMDTLTILDSDLTGRLRATRVVPGAPRPTDGVVIGQPAEAASAVALSRKAEAVVFAHGGLVLYTTVVW